jgi:hypothetical protein
VVVQVIVIESEQNALRQGIEGLWRIAADLGANTLAVLEFEAASCEIAYCRTQEGVLRVLSRIPCAVEMPAGGAALPAQSAPACFLKSAVAPAANSFFLCPASIQAAQARKVAIVFGFEARELNLAVLAAWSVEEVRRLRAELSAVNRAFAGRKLVERAKLTLQSERGMNEREAYEYLRRMSRQRRIPMSTLAWNLLTKD